MAASEACFLTIAEAAQLIQKRELSPADLAESCLRRIEQVDGKVNAFGTLTADLARSEAKAAEAEIIAGRYRGPMHGIPIAFKDVIKTKGIRTTVGSKAFWEMVPEEDATLVANLKQAGGIVLGKVNTHEMHRWITTAISCFGATHNPWDLTRSAAGSSGGSGAAVAARECLGAVGTDTGGSIRMPAAVCGIVGLKPTYGRVSRYGIVPLVPSMDHAGPMAKTVEDCAIMLGAMAGRDPNDQSSADVPVPDYTRSLGRGVAGLRVGVPRRFFFDNLDTEVASAVEEAISVIKGLGAQVRDYDIPDVDQYGLSSSVIIYAESAAMHDQLLRERSELLHPHTRMLLETGRLVLATDYIRAQQARSMLIEKMRAVFHDVDVLVTSTTSVTATLLDAPPQTVRLGGSAGIQNLTGIPAISIPCGFSKAGLPIGLQIAGPAFGEETIFQVAHAYEQATDWHTRRPPL